MRSQLPFVAGIWAFLCFAAVGDEPPRPGTVPGVDPLTHSTADEVQCAQQCFFLPDGHSACVPTPDGGVAGQRLVTPGAVAPKADSRDGEPCRFEDDVQFFPIPADAGQPRSTAAIDQPVTVRVKVMELRAGGMRKLGLDFENAERSGFEQLLPALQQDGLLKVLADPTLVTVSGRPATLQSGGEIPVAMSSSGNSRKVECRQFGTRVDCVPEVLDSGRIRLELKATVSLIEASGNAIIQNNSVPGLRGLSAHAEVEVIPGTTAVVAYGRCQHRPIGGSQSAEVEDTALLITVTATLGEPGR